MGVGRGPWPEELGYLGELAWCAQHGVAQTYEQYLDLPLSVISDCRMVMRAQELMRADG